MVNMYGAGKAFNLRYQQPSLHRPIAPHRARALNQGPIIQSCGGHHHCGPQNVTINNGPQGFWGFMSGLVNGLFGGMGMGGLFGGMGGFNQMPMNTFGMLNQAALGNNQQGGINELANLKQMYSKYSVIDNGNGTYTLTTGNGDNVKTGTYDELMKGIKSTTETTETETTETETTETETTGTETTGTETTGTETTDTTTTTTTTSTASDTTTTGGSATPGTAAKADELKGYNGKFSVSDKARGTGDIARNTCIVSSEKVDGFPKQITVGGYTYDYVRTEDGAAIYKSTAASAAGDEYRLEKNADGTFGLNQYKGMKGAGTADITQAGKAKAVKSLGHDNMAGEKPWSTEQKAEYKEPIEVQFALHTAGMGTTGGTATAKMPDGSVVTIKLGGYNFTDKGAVNDASEKLLDAIHAAGWTGVTTITNNSNALKEATGTGDNETFKYSKEFKGNVNVDNGNVKIGKDGGETVAEALGGYTSDADKKEAISTINAQTPSSIKSFLKGYNSEFETGKDPIMQQIATENEWSDVERKSCYQKIIANLLVASKGQEGTEAYKGLQDIYNNLLTNKIQTLTEDQAKACDKWINELTQQ